MLCAERGDRVANESKSVNSGLMAPKTLAGLAAILQVIAMVLLATERIASDKSVPILAISMILWIIAFAGAQKPKP